MKQLIPILAVLGALLGATLVLAQDRTPAQDDRAAPKHTSTLAAGSQTRPAPPSSTPVVQAAGAHAVKVEWKAGKLSVAADSVPLSAVLWEVARRTGIELQGNELLHETVSMEFAGVPLEEGLRKLVGRVDYAIEDVPREHDAAEIRVVVFEEQTVAAQTVAAKSGGRQARETASEKALRPGEQELQKALADEDPAVRAAVLEALAEESDTGSVDGANNQQAGSDRLRALERLVRSGDAEEPTVLAALSSALKDGDSAVRAFAIQELANHDGAEAMSDLRQAYQDPDPKMRLLVIDSVGPRDESRELLEQAAGDSDESVSQEAARLLKQLAPASAK